MPLNSALIDYRNLTFNEFQSSTFGGTPFQQYSCVLDVFCWYNNIIYFQYFVDFGKNFVGCEKYVFFSISSVVEVAYVRLHCAWIIFGSLQDGENGSIMVIQLKIYSIKTFLIT